LRRQEGREKVVKQESNDLRLRGELSRSVHQQPVLPNETVHLSNLAKLDSRMDAANTARKQNIVGILNNIMDIMQNNPAIDVIELARQIGRSRSMTYKYLAELEISGQIHRNGGDGKTFNL
jgi:hypothetical protein